MADIYDIAEQYKARLVSRERRAASVLVRAYAAAYGRVRAKLTEITTEIDAARARGERISQGWLYERDRLASLEREIAGELNYFSNGATKVLTGEQLAAVRLGFNDARSLVGFALDSQGLSVRSDFSSLNRSAVESLAGFSADGSPLFDLLNEAGRRAGAKARLELIAGVAEGADSAVIGRRVRDAMGIGLSRSLTIARTETIRAYREASHATYKASGDVLKGWVWTASLSSRTCAMCLAMSGQIFSLDESLDSHPNCRCVQVPLTRDAVAGASGEEWLAAQPEETQREVLGDAAYEALMNGEIKLSDLVGTRRDPRWGLTRYEKPLSAVKKK